MRNKVRYSFCVVCLMPLLVLSGDYYSNDIFEPDKVAFVWMIKKFVDKDARFYFLGKDSTKANATAFDLQSAKYRRYPKYSTTMSVVKIHKINDPKAIKLANLIDEIELDFWGSQKSEKAKNVERRLRSLFDNEKNADSVVVKSLKYLNSIVDSF
jgi:hypothetical protein